MKKFLAIGCMALVLASCGGKDDQKGDTDASASTAIESVEDKVNYSMGMEACASFAQIWAKLGLQISADNQAFIDGMRDQLEGKAELSFEDAQVQAGAFFQKLQNEEPMSEDDAKSFSYAQGVIMASTAKSRLERIDRGDKLETAVFLSGASDYIAGAEPKVSDEDRKELLTNLLNEENKNQAESSLPKFDIKDVGGFDEMSEDDKLAYAFGMQMAASLYEFQAQPQINERSFILDEALKGIKAAIDGQKPSSSYQTLAQSYYTALDEQNYSNKSLIKEFSFEYGVFSQFNFFRLMNYFGQKEQTQNQLFYKAIEDFAVNKEAVTTFENATMYLEEQVKGMPQALFEKNKEEGEAFMAKNRSAAGVKETESGIQYKVLKQGNGAKPALSSRVKVHYHGTYLNGEVFDSSVDRGEPAEFGLNQVIAGWTEGVQLMPVGSKFRFWIPQQLAYGQSNPRNGIQPGCTLVFDVELLDIVK